MYRQYFDLGLPRIGVQCFKFIPSLSPLIFFSPSPTLLQPPPSSTGCRNVDDFQCLNRIEEGTFGVVYRALDKKFEEIVALKRLKMEKEKEGFPITSLREINTLLKVEWMRKGKECACLE